MTHTIVDVPFPFVYDLYYRTRNALLESEVYRIDFMDWVSAGVAFNTLGSKDPRRKVAYFGKLYDLIEGRALEANVEVFRVAVMRFYEDLYKLYNDHLLAQLKFAKRQRDVETAEPASLILIPCFVQVPDLYEILPSQDIEIVTYECKYPGELREDMSTIYAVEGTTLYRGMGLVFQKGYARG